jgi:uncharacterized protein
VKDFSAVTARLREELESRPANTPGATSESNIAAVHAQIDAIARGDLDAVLAQAAPDVALSIFAPPEFPWIRRARGIEELRAAIRQNFAAVEEQRPEISSVFAEGDAVVIFGHERGRLVATGAAYSVEFVQRYTFRDGRLADVRIIAAHAVASPPTT